MNCRVCDSTNLELAIDLGQHPCCLHFLTQEEVGKEPFYPLRLMFCHDCGTTQLDYTIKKELMYSDHTYLSGVTKMLSDHFQTVAEEADELFCKNKEHKSVLDIGSNDGTQLKHFQKLGYEVLGVEASKTTARIANEAGVPTLNDFFNLEVVKKLNKKFDIINAAGVFFHLEELHSVTEGIREALADDGVFVVQFMYIKSILENLAFDQIYHEHLLFYTLKTIEVLLQRHGLSMFDAQLSSIHGGSIIGYVTHKSRNLKPSERLERMRAMEDLEKTNELETYLDFAERIKVMKEFNLQYLRDAKKAGKKIYGFGAPVKGNTMLNYFGVGTEYLDCLVEKNELRRGLYSPGMHIPIAIEKELTELPDIYYVLAWNFKKEILANNKQLIEKGVEFYFPVDPVEKTIK
ncbi:MAG: methyltransferase [Verrucomicrobia bacterium CG_4_10_14_3_um_filter_43_23]|nr:MAG: methyltransferase [Verrucomicrobia bacterium CG1_02_43_26]PIP59027.1 MAG: methyltransferase [Verrucomicrobia bacterium CG22_combo_CG10-13_8_21_14_all_43_17]PIX59124.1 MAG: methyltransferase [Verrucomicrobia bacterium CG_4_10_14_3_um_filter_43_23]PIY61354.1 MAG: methyltransferase [Verrucomicrobia bacterium CG_4_10_14_0_8_um_filter_43_34]PJA44135.1 MAG: methyltransferase [Verrucomicrobia bacterium CG_4_9_14_3_um_filter_43_20]